MKGRVIRMLDEHTIVVNIGKWDGVNVGDQFGIYTPTDDVIDPATSERLGSYRARKALVEIGRVFDRFSIATSTVRYRSAMQRTVAGLAGEPISDPLPIFRNELQPLPGGMEIRLGDPVELIRAADQRRPEQQASKPPTQALPPSSQQAAPDSESAIDSESAPDAS